MHREAGAISALALICCLLPALTMAAGSVTISWNANAESDLAGYRIYYGASSGNYSNVVTVGNATAYTFNSLNGGATYYFVVAAYDDSGNESGYSAEVSATVIDTTPPLITAVAAKNITTSGASITWSTDEAADSQVDYGVDANYGNTSTLNPQRVTTHTIILSGLNVNTTYHYRVNSRDAAGLLATSGDFTFTTLAPDATPPQISNLAAASVSSNSATISWTTDEPADSQVEFGETADYGRTTTGSKNLETNHRVVISALSASTPYHFRVLSKDGAGNLAMSTDQTFTTTGPSSFVQRVNAGGEAYTDATGQAWFADQEYITGSLWGYDYGEIASKPDPIANTEDDVLFQSERHGAGGYRFEVPAVGRYRVKLLFAEIVYNEAQKRIFDVTIENEPVIDDLDLFATFGYNVAAAYTFDVEVLDGRLAVKFFSVIGEPTISAIEVTSLEASGGGDLTPPSAISATLTSRNSLAVVFDEPVSVASAQSVANYAINPAVNVNSAVLQSDQRTVLLTTADHASGQSYTLTVRNVADLATPPNLMSQPATFNYTYRAPDGTPPSAISATLSTINSLTVIFSEPVGVASAQNVANYAINPAVNLNSAALQSDQRTVVLTTGNHTSGQNYTITIRNIADLASPPNVMTSPATFNYTYQAIDTTPPAMISATALNRNTVNVLFSEPVAGASAQDKNNYSMSPALEIVGASLLSDQRTVQLTTGNHASGQSYTLTVRNVNDLASPPNAMAGPATLQYTYQEVDVTPPAALSATASDRNTVSVLFSEAVTVASAQSKANYGISPAITIDRAVLQSDSRTVILATGNHTDGANYVLTVRNVSDRAPAPNLMPAPATINYAYQAVDNTRPRLAGVSIDSPARVVVTFSEKVTVASAQAVANYRISDGVSVTNAVAAANGVEVELTTTSHQVDRDYTLTVNNVRDRSAASNGIAQNSSMSYRLAGNRSGLVVNSLSLGNYRVDSLRVGDAYYVDRTYHLNHIPASKRRALWIRTANADKASNSTNFLEFNINREADVYIAYDSRATGVPAWLSRDYDKTNEYIGVSETVGRMDLWRGHFLPGRVRLGGNLATGAANVNSMYVVLIDDLQKPAGADQEAPRSFVLYQNYPNPFNPRTEIGYYVDRESYVVISIYNYLGQTVRTLYEGRQRQGQHRLTWDGRDGRDQPAPSGTYLYTLEVREQMSSGGMQLNSAVSRQSLSMTLLK